MPSGLKQGGRRDHGYSRNEAIAILNLAKRNKKKTPASTKTSSSEKRAEPAKANSTPASPAQGAAGRLAGKKSQRQSKLAKVTLRIKGKAVKGLIVELAKQAKKIADREPATWRSEDIAAISGIIDKVSRYRVGWNFSEAELAIRGMEKWQKKISLTLNPPARRPPSPNPDRTRINEYGSPSGRITWATRKRRK